jgi:hypothetical protein
VGKRYKRAVRAHKREVWDSATREQLELIKDVGESVTREQIEERCGKALQESK